MPAVRASAAAERGAVTAAHRFLSALSATYFSFRFDSVFPRGDKPAATILRAPSGFQIYLEGEGLDPLPAWFHFGFFVESDAACRELYERMQQAQVPIVRPLVSEPFTNYLCADPDGRLVQV
jgi:hypothetical protein